MYLGIQCIGGKVLKVNIDIVKCSFVMACKCVLIIQDHAEKLSSCNYKSCIAYRFYLMVLNLSHSMTDRLKFKLWLEYGLSKHFQL